jgi:transglutaminase-like putative cysteine protease
MKNSPVRWDWPAAALVFLLIQVSAGRLVITSWAPDLFITQTSGAWAVILGLALGYSRFRRQVVRRVFLLYTLVMLPLQLTAATAHEEWLWHKLILVGQRLALSAGQFARGQDVEDALFFVAFAVLAYWLMGAAAGYSLARYQNYLMAVVPAGMVMIIVQVYDSYIPVRIWALALYLFLALLLLGRLYLQRNQAEWREKRVFLTAEALEDFQRGLLAVTAILVLVAWTLPPSLESIQTAARSWNELVRPLRDRLEKAVRPLESPQTVRVNNTADFYGPRLSLGQQAARGETAVFNVTVSSPEAGPPRYYWRAWTYETYSGGQWSNPKAVTTAFRPEQNDLAVPAGGRRVTMLLDVTVRLARQSTIYAAAEPVWVNVPGEFLATLTPDGRVDVATWRADPPLEAGARYQVRARIANPSISELRAAGTAYPAWVQERYLQIPAEIEPQIRQLAEEITRGAETPYDKAAAITDYLRREIEYRDTLPAVPQGREPLLWVLFDEKKGFCNYYASAEVMLLRSVGVPARLAVGFAEGELQERTQLTGRESEFVYVVRQKHSHAWPEVYFPEIGWVEFEPTGNQEPLIRPLQPPQAGAVGGQIVPPRRSLPLEEADSGQTPNQVQPSFWQTLRRVVVPLIFRVGVPLLVIAGLYLTNRRFRVGQRFPRYLQEMYRRQGLQSPRWLERWVRWNDSSPLERAFHVVNLSLRWLGKPPPVHATAAERAEALRALLPAAATAIEVLLSEHQAALYTRQTADARRARRAAWQVFFQALRSRFGLQEDSYEF